MKKKNYFIVIAKYMANLEYSSDRLNRAKPETVAAWTHLVVELTELLQGQ